MMKEKFEDRTEGGLGLSPRRWGCGEMTERSKNDRTGTGIFCVERGIEPRGKAFPLIFLMIITFSFIFDSCSSEKKQILDGVWAHYEGKYTEATADFLNVANRCDDGALAKNYAVFDLAATYISLGELDSALDRLYSLNLDDENLPADFRSAAFYNIGVIFTRYSDYKNAAENFKKAVLADSKNLSAKINLELCQRQLVQKQTNAGQATMTGVNEEKSSDSSMESEIFNLIRENEGKKWQNMSESSEKDDDVLDY